MSFTFFLKYFSILIHPFTRFIILFLLLLLRLVYHILFRICYLSLVILLRFLALCVLDHNILSVLITSFYSTAYSSSQSYSDYSSQIQINSSSIHHHRHHHRPNRLLVNPSLASDYGTRRLNPPPSFLSFSSSYKVGLTSFIVIGGGFDEWSAIAFIAAAADVLSVTIVAVPLLPGPETEGICEGRRGHNKSY